MPPHPGAPGTTPVGQAYYGFGFDPSGNYAPPFDVFENNYSLFNISKEQFGNKAPSDKVEFTAFVKYNTSDFVKYKYNLIFRYFYLYENTPECIQATNGCGSFATDACCKGWRAKQWNGQPVTIATNGLLVNDNNSPWISMSTDPVNPISLDVVKLLNGTNFMLAYACKRVSEQWRCNCAKADDANSCGKWMLQMFNVNSVTITVTSPTEGAIVSTAVVPVQFTSVNIPAGMKIKAYVDGNAQTPLLDPTATSYNTPSLGNGLRNVKFEVVNADGTSLSPTIISSVRSFTVAVPPGPSITITSPAEGAPVTTAVVSVAFTPANIPSDKKIKAYVDGNAQTPLLDPTATSYNTPSLGNGLRNVKFEVVNADGTPLSPPIITPLRSFTVTVGTAECATNADCGLDVQCACAKKTPTSGTCNAPPAIPTSVCICEAQTKKCLTVSKGTSSIEMVSTTAGFSPPTLTVLKGIQIRWKNIDTVAHTATHDVTTPLFDTTTILPGSLSEAKLFNTVGTFPYKCTLHQNMPKGEIKVVEDIPASAAPTITITSPAEGASVTTAVVPVAFIPANIPSDKKIKAYVGDIPQTPLLDPTATSYNTPSLGNGLRNVKFEVVNADGTPLSPPIISSVRSFTVAVPSGPSITIASPANAATVTTPIVTVQFTTTNAAGKKVKVLVDDAQFGSLLEATAPSVTTGTLTNAQHKVKLEIVNQDGTSLSPVAAQEITFTVAIATQPDLRIQSFTFGNLNGNNVPITITINNSGVGTAVQPFELNYSVYDGKTNELKFSSLHMVHTIDLLPLQEKGIPIPSVVLGSSINITVIAHINARRNITESNFDNNIGNQTEKYGLQGPGSIGQ